MGRRRPKSARVLGRLDSIASHEEHQQGAKIQGHAGDLAKAWPEALEASDATTLTRARRWIALSF